MCFVSFSYKVPAKGDGVDYVRTEDEVSSTYISYKQCCHNIDHCYTGTIKSVLFSYDNVLTPDNKYRDRLLDPDVYAVGEQV